jgi:hypothetical protein
MKNRLLFVLAFAALAFAPIQAQTLDEIINKHVEALGGADKLKTVNTIYSEAAIAVQGMEIPSKRHLVVGKSIRSESIIMGSSMVQAFNGDKGWKIMPAMMGGTGEPEDMNAEEAKSMNNQLDPFGGLYNYQEKGSKVELVGTEKVDKKEMFHLKVTSAQGQVAHLYLDTKTYLIYKMTAETNGQAIEMIMSDYKAVDGVQFAHTTDMTTAMGNFTVVTSKTLINNPIDEKVFAKPVK